MKRFNAMYRMYCDTNTEYTCVVCGTQVKQPFNDTQNTAVMACSRKCMNQNEQRIKTWQNERIKLHRIKKLLAKISKALVQQNQRQLQSYMEELEQLRNSQP